MSINAVEQSDLVTLLRRACEQRAAVQLRYCAPDGSLESTRIRMAEFADGVIYIDGCEDVIAQFGFHPNQALLGFFELDRRRYQFVSRVRRRPAPAGVLRRKSQTRLAMDLPPGVIEEQHQRCDYRVTVAGRHTIPVILVQVDPLNVGACPVGARRYETQLVDISAGGLSVTGDIGALDGLNVKDRYYASFLLPDAPRPLDLLLQVCHLRCMPEQNICRVGCAIQRWPGSNLRHDAHYIIQFVMQEQFKVVRHQRG